MGRLRRVEDSYNRTGTTAGFLSPPDSLRRASNLLCPSQNACGSAQVELHSETGHGPSVAVAFKISARLFATVTISLFVHGQVQNIVSS